MDKLEAINNRIPFVLGDYSSPTRLCDKCVQNFLILLHKSLFFTHFRAYMKNMLPLRSSSYDLRGNYILSLRKT